MKLWKLAVLAACVSASGQVWAEVYLSPAVPYQNEENIAVRIVRECTAIGSTLTESAVKASQRGKVKLAAAEDFAGQNEYVKAEILSATGIGSAMIGHWKGITVQAEYYRDGKLVEQTKLERHSTGGFFGGFKSSCSVLNRTANTLGKDLAAWVEQVAAK